mgnify:CR=1 FL=1
MILYEFEGKKILHRAGIPVPTSQLLSSPADQVGLQYPVVLKAQVLSGDVDEGLNTLERVLDIAADAEPKDFPFIIAIERRIAEILHTQGRSDEAIEIERRIASISEILED